MLLLPPALLLLVNGVRLAETIAVSRTATVAACQAAADASVELRFYSRTGNQRLYPRTAQNVAARQFASALADLHRRGIVERAYITVTIHGTTLSCNSRVLYNAWILQDALRRWGVWLTFQPASQIYIGKR